MTRTDQRVMYSPLVVAALAITYCSAANEKNTTCSVLEEIANNAVGFQCTADTTEPCRTVDCAYQPYTAEFELLPCQSPVAAMRVVIKQGEALVLNETIDHSDAIQLSSFLVLNITFDHFDDAVGLQIVAAIPGSGSIDVVKYTVIPLEKAKNCGRVKVTPTVTPEISPTATSTPRSAGFQCSFIWPLLLLSLLSSTMI